ncbi:radical SAM protein [Ghiorsea bivora]|uniref:radical SAM protein n=1 Tax=Ghiorsea bivora TaxID=1485545 RepID=UPI000A7981CC
MQRGVADEVDLTVLEKELDSFLVEILYGTYMQEHVPEQCRQLQDLAISGNGEPTTCLNFSDVVALIVRLMQKHKLDIPLRLISNGSCVHKTHIQKGLMLMAKQQGEVWFKVDVLGEAMTKAINGVCLSAAWQTKQLQQAAQVCPTWIQTCVMQLQLDDDMYMTNYVSWLNEVLAQGANIKGVLLYGLARPSMQDGGDKLVSADKNELAVFAQKIESLGLAVKVS